MDQILSTLLSTLDFVTQAGIILFQFIAVCVLIIACVQTLMKFIHHKHHTVIHLRKWMNVSLLFILCSEILRLITVHSFSEVIVIFCIVLIHAAISVLSNWEMTREMKIYRERLKAQENSATSDIHKNDINL